MAQKQAVGIYAPRQKKHGRAKKKRNKHKSSKPSVGQGK